MSTTEIPAGDSEGDGFANQTTDQSEPEVAPANAPANSKKAAEAEGKSMICQRVSIGGLLLIVVAIAVIGTVIAVVPELKKKESTKITEDPFQVELPLFSANITEPYVSIEEARNDIEQLAKSIVNMIILDEANHVYDFGCLEFVSSNGQPMNEMFAGFKSSGAAPISASASDSSEGKSGSASAFEGADDFETYQHETGVLKSDLVKSNGVHVFAAVDDRILVWGLEGTLFETITMPSIKTHDQSENEPYNYNWSPQPYIKALLMNPEGTKLTVVVSGYGVEHETISSKKGGEVMRPIVHNYLGTRVVVFGIEGSTLTELSQTDINGYHVDSYMVGSNVHIVTKMRLNTCRYLSDPLKRLTFFQDMTNDEYFAAAILKAEEIMPEFVNKVVDIVTVEDKIVLSRLAVFADSISESSDINIDDLFGGNVARTITQVNSFDTGTIGSEDDMTLNISKSLVLQPGNTEYVYATDEWIWVTDQGWAWNLEEGKYAEQTMLLGFRLDGSSSTFAAVGSVPGSLLSQFSIDFVRDNDNANAKEYVRIATTQNFFQNRLWGGPQPDESSSRTMNQIVIFEVPKAEDNDKNSKNVLVRLGSVELGKKDETITAVRFFDNISYVVTFEQTDPFYVLDLSDPMDPKVLGKLEIPGFSRFMHPIKDDNSMLITVGQDADENGRILGLQISIFDSTIPTDPKLIDRLVIVEDDDGKGSWSGSSASWDERAFRYIRVGDDDDLYGRLIIPVDVYASWDNFGNKVGEDFEGFMVFGVDLTKTENLITREVEIDHSPQNDDDDDDASTAFVDISECYCGHTYTWLPERSMVFDGNLMTLRNQEVISTSLVTHETQWNLTIKDDDDGNCCYP